MKYSKETIIALIIGIIIGIAISALTLQTAPSIIQTSCDIDINSLYGKPCTIDEDCYGRLEVCSKYSNQCMTTTDNDKTDLRNTRIPSTQNECEANGGTWNVEMIAA